MVPGAPLSSARFNRLDLSAPLVKASSGHPELLGHLIDAFTALHPLYGHALKLPGISLSSLHCCFLSRRVCPSRVCQFKGSFQFRSTPPQQDEGVRRSHCRGASNDIRMVVLYHAGIVHTGHSRREFLLLAKNIKGRSVTIDPSIQPTLDPIRTILEGVAVSIGPVWC